MTPLWNKEDKDRFANYATEIYAKSIEEALRAKIEVSNDTRDAINILSDLEEIVEHLSSANRISINKDASLVQRHTDTVPTYSGFAYHQEQYKDFFDVVEDFRIQTGIQWRNLYEGLQCSNKILTDYVDPHKPVKMTVRKHAALMKNKDRYLERLTYMARLKPDEKEHLLALPLVHPDKYEKAYKGEPL